MSIPPATALPSPGYARYVLGVMALMYTCNHLDRFVLTMMIQPIKRDLEISDAMVDFSIGPAFASFYTLFGVPTIRWADVGLRRTIIALEISSSYLSRSRERGSAPGP